MLVIVPPPVRGVGTAGGFRMMIEDRAGRGPEALQAAVSAMIGARRAGAGPAPGVLAVRDVDAAALSRHRPRQGAAAGHQPARRVRRAADLPRLVLRQRLQPARPHLPRHRAGRGEPSGSTRRTCCRSACATRQAKPCRSARSRACSDTTGPYRVPRYNLYPAAELDGQPAPGFSQGQAIDTMQKIARETLPPASASSGRRSPSSRSRPATPRRSPSCSAWCSCSSCSPRSTRA